MPLSIHSTRATVWIYGPALLNDALCTQWCRDDRRGCLRGGGLRGGCGFDSLRHGPGIFRSQREWSPRVESLGILGRRLESFVGGARWPGGNASLGLARLDFYEYGLRLHGSIRALDRLLPDVQLRYSEVECAESVVSTSRARGLRLRFPQQNGWIIFWTTMPVEQLLGRLATVDAPIRAETRRISFLTGLDL